ncbi:type III-A CRISPR-associated RAMP protein Csm5 [Streptococcus uberis]|uniref:type III-A CRISPR-associated RAMP protein Csm5 n=1 Tax=Streptococcus uberis TaxID=1349 RepID=UPI001FF6F66D|nr:type III-A CRISPR-associated RAMP protein Csm5 [Streptococcus uberis]MCK1219323.1 type III-A CRISPR-associated RAMP protein Csm5 [Streptococcus uberis]
MEKFYKQFKFSLWTVGPVHIGSGEKYTSKEFIWENKQYYFPDMGKLYNYLIEIGLDEKFEKFLLDGRNKRKRLNSFFYDNKISNRDFDGYFIKETKFEKTSSTQGQLNDIEKFIRNGLGQVYIPGSSLKGSIRTILLNTHWKDENFILEVEQRRRNQGRKKENKKLIPWGSKKEIAFNDIFNEIRVSDSGPISNERLIITQKWDFSSKTNQEKLLPVFRESIDSLTPVEFTITTTTKRAYDLIKTLPVNAKAFYQNYQSFFLSDFPSELRQDNIQSPIYLGAGSGVWTKTIINQANGIIQKRYMNLPNTKMVGKGVMKLTKAREKKYKIGGKENRLIKNQGNFYEMGKSCFKLEEY